LKPVNWVLPQSRATLGGNYYESDSVAVKGIIKLKAPLKSGS